MGTSGGIAMVHDVTELRLLQASAAAAGSVLVCCATAHEALKRLRADAGQYLLVDYPVHSSDALDLIGAGVSADASIAVMAILPSGENSDLQREVIRAGVHDVIVRPLTSEFLQLKIRSVARQRDLLGAAQSDLATREQDLRDTVGEVLLREHETLNVLGRASEYKDEDTGSHIRRVAHYSRLIARMIGLDENTQDLIYHSSTLHDVGKIGIPEVILRKPGRLDDREMEVIKTHTTKGHAILANSDSTYLLSGAMIALTHHERYDGHGYPMGLAGADIPLHGRIVCIADVFDALTTRRPYKAPWSMDRAFGLLQDERGRQFDPELVEAFVCNAPRVESIYYEYSAE